MEFFNSHACLRQQSRCHGHDAIPGQAVFLPCRHLSPTREICDNIGNPADDVRAHESSRNFLDSRSRVYRIPTDWPGPANFQQPLNYGRIPWSANRISPSHHVHSPGGAPTKTCFDCTFHRRNPAGLGHFPRKPRLRAKAKALIQTGRTEAGDPFLLHTFHRRHASNPAITPNDSECKRLTEYVFYARPSIKW